MKTNGRATRLSMGVVATLALMSPSYAVGRDRGTSATSSALGLSIFNFGQVNAAYFRGAELDAADARTLAARGVRTVVDLRSDADYQPSEETFVENAGMKYMRIPMTTRVAPATAQVVAFLALVTDPVNQPVYVHCVEGRHRTGVMTAVYRMSVDGWTAARAFREMKDFRFGLDFLHPEFKKFVFGYHPVIQVTAASAALSALTAN